MSEELATALIGALVSVALAWFASQRNAAQVEQRIMIAIAELKIRQDTLWRTVVEDGLRDARKAHLAVSNSPHRSTQGWRDMVGGDFDLQLRKRAKELVDAGNTATWAAALLFDEYNEKMIEIARRYDLAVSALLAVVSTIADEVSRNE